jgi:hypothetical protein
MRKHEKEVSLLPGDSRRRGKAFWVKLAIGVVVLGMILVLATSVAANGIRGHLPNLHARNAQAASPSQQSIDTPYGQANSAAQATNTTQTTNVLAASGAEQRIDIPYFNSSPVPFNQTAIFWFGTIDSSHVYADVRVGYNNSELYVDLQIVDRYLWYDTNKQAPDINAGDNASVYLNAENNGALASTAYKFQVGVSGFLQWSSYQKAYTRNGGAWTAANIPYSVGYGTRTHGFNGLESFGWSATYHIPFTSLGMKSAPSQGTLWKLAVRLHNRDDAANTPIPDTWWPAAGSETNPAGWGDLMFGLAHYTPPQTNDAQTYTVRNGLNGQVVTDGMVGGSLDCGGMGIGLQHWSVVGSATYPGAIHTNIQNESDVSDWNCFSKWYITFPLSSLPKGKGIANATVTLYEYANAGVQGQPNPSYIQVAQIGQNWNPQTLSWNTAPYITENINSIYVPTKSKPVIPFPGLAITWNVSIAVARAYASGQPLRLVFYSTDNQYNTGKYFTSSYVAAWDATGRPTLQVTAGNII